MEEESQNEADPARPQSSGSRLEVISPSKSMKDAAAQISDIELEVEHEDGRAEEEFQAYDVSTESDNGDPNEVCRFKRVSSSRCDLRDHVAKTGYRLVCAECISLGISDRVKCFTETCFTETCFTETCFTETCFTETCFTKTCKIV